MRYSKTFLVFIALCIAHLGEHIAQLYQAYVLNIPIHKSGGLLGYLYPPLLHSETLHYGYALLMLVGLWFFRGFFAGPGRWWWMLAFGVQFWHHIEHALLLYQATTGRNFFGAPQPISVIQFTGFFFGSPETGFGGNLTMSHFGVCTCQNAKPGTIHEWSWKLITVRRLEVHLMYNMLVTIPMVAAMIRNRPPEPEPAV